MRRSIDSRTSSWLRPRRTGALLCASFMLTACSDLAAPDPHGNARRALSSSPVPAPADVTSFDETFHNAPVQCMRDGDSFAGWSIVVTAHGCVRHGSGGGQTWLQLAPRPARSPEETGAPLVVGPPFGNPIDLQVRLITDAQLRTGSEPHQREVGWVIWHYTDPEQFYYFIPGPDGWELGKRDAAYPGGHRVLATASQPVYPLGTWHDVRVVQTGAVMKVWSDGVLLVQFEDRERAYMGGRVGLYSEDAAARFANVKVTG